MIKTVVIYFLQQPTQFWNLLFIPAVSSKINYSKGFLINISVWFGAVEVWNLWVEKYRDI